MRIYKILGAGEWSAALERGVFEGSQVDLQDGYIHFSTGAQLAQTAAKWFRDRQDLVILEVEATDLADLRFEPARGGDLFPHLYGVLPARLVRAVHPAPLGADGAPITGNLP